MFLLSVHLLPGSGRRKGGTQPQLQQRMVKMTVVKRFCYQILIWIIGITYLTWSGCLMISSMSTAITTED